MKDIIVLRYQGLLRAAGIILLWALALSVVYWAAYAGTEM